MSKNLMTVKDLSISFHTQGGEVEAVRNVSFEIAENEIVAIVGESGSGKSVMTQSLMKLLPSPPATYKSGQVVFDGEDITGYKRKKLMHIKGNKVSYVFQDPMTSLNPLMKVGNQIVEGIRTHRKVSRKKAKSEAIELLRIMGIPNPEKRFTQYPHEMSGGMRQRVIIAIAIACNPKLVIADEPTTALDVTIQSQILEILADLNKSYGTSVLLITHNLGIVAGIAERVMVMYGGKIIENASVDELFANPIHPYTQALLQAVPRLDDDSEKELGFIVGSPPNVLNLPKGCAFAPRCKYCMKICNEIYPETYSVGEHQAACWLIHKKGSKVREYIDGQVSKIG